MNKTLVWIFAGATVTLCVLVFLFGGLVFMRMMWGWPAFGRGWMMGNYNPAVNSRPGAQFPAGMMGGMMNGNSGMMGGSSPASLYGVKPLSLAAAKGAVENYLNGRGNSELAIGEVMIFDNQAYVMVKEKSTGMGAFEVLVDPVTLTVSPEPGPNMMWNQKYGMMGGGMMGGGMMGGYAYPGRGGQVSAAMPVSAEDAVKTAQAYLDAYIPGSQSEDEADAFYGYYTLHILRGGKITGMLSVNGYTGQVFVHTWHGNFIEMGE